MEAIIIKHYRFTHFATLKRTIGICLYGWTAGGEDASVLICSTDRDIKHLLQKWPATCQLPVHVCARWPTDSSASRRVRCPGHISGWICPIPICWCARQRKAHIAQLKANGRPFTLNVIYSYYRHFQKSIMSAILSLEPQTNTISTALFSRVTHARQAHRLRRIITFGGEPHVRRAQSCV